MGRNKAPILTLLEGRWFPDKNVSVRDLFVPLFTVWTKNEDGAHHYEMFTNKQAFCDAIEHAFGPGRAETIYIAAHGNENGIEGFHDSKVRGIKRAVIRNALKKANSTQSKRGIYFGSCLFATETNARFILAACPRVEWIAGYTTEVDWIDSSVLDLFFLRHFLFPAPGKGRRLPHSARERLDYAVGKVVTDMGPLAQRTGFCVYARTRGRGAKIANLAEEAAAPPRD